jgi:membrane fusion protein, multidrug efflux system
VALIAPLDIRRRCQHYQHSPSTAPRNTLQLSGKPRRQFGYPLATLFSTGTGEPNRFQHKVRALLSKGEGSVRFESVPWTAIRTVETTKPARKRRQILPIAGFSILLGLMIGLATGCGRLGKQPPATSPAVVTVSRPIEREVTDYADFSGRTAAVESVEVRARVNGYLEKLNFTEGELVHKGDVLFEIDPRPYQAQVDIATGQIAAADAMVQRTQADDARAKSLRASTPGAISQQDLDQYQAAADQATANADTARATLKKNQLDLDFTKVVSPIDGRVSRFYATVGNLVVQDQTLLTTIVSVDPIYAYFDVDESTVLRVRELIRTGKMKSAREVSVPAWLSLTNDEGFSREGIINFIDNQVDPKTGTLRLRGVFPNKDEALSPGFFVRVRVRIGVPHTSLLVAERAIDTDQGQKVVYVVNEKNEVIYRPVRVGTRHGSMVAVDEGLKSGEQVIVNGLQRVRPGATVDPKLVDMPGSTEADTSAATASAGATGNPPSKQQ